MQAPWDQPSPSPACICCVYCMQVGGLPWRWAATSSAQHGSHGCGRPQTSRPGPGPAAAACPLPVSHRPRPKLQRASEREEGNREREAVTRPTSLGRPTPCHLQQHLRPAVTTATPHHSTDIPRQASPPRLRLHLHSRPRALIVPSRPLASRHRPPPIADRRPV